MIMTIAATALMGDWQAIRHDPCTDASLFHHPELLHTYTTQMDQAPAITNQSESASGVDIQCEKLNLSLSVQQHLSSTTVNIHVYPNIVTDEVIFSYGCEVVDSCPYCSMDWTEAMRTYSATPTCLHLRVNSQQQCLEKYPLLPWQQENKPHPLYTSYQCTMPRSHFTYCLQVQPLSPGQQVAGIQEEEAYVANIHRQSAAIMEGRIDHLASQTCQKQGDNCHWNPSSSVTHNHCEDCPPICRDRSNYLEFSQFTIAAALLLVAVPVARVPITSIISDIVTPNQQVCGRCTSREILMFTQCALLSRELSWDWLRP